EGRRGRQAEAEVGEGVVGVNEVDLLAGDGAEKPGEGRGLSRGAADAEAEGGDAAGQEGGGHVVRGANGADDVAEVGGVAGGDVVQEKGLSAADGERGENVQNESRLGHAGRGGSVARGRSSPRKRGSGSGEADARAGRRTAGAGAGSTSCCSKKSSYGAQQRSISAGGSVGQARSCEGAISCEACCRRAARFCSRNG